MAYLEIAVKILEEDDDLGGICTYQLDRQAYVLGNESFEWPKWNVLHYEEQARLVL